jgi:uncharacterized LabA/DUF88 family protein
MQSVDFAALFIDGDNLPASAVTRAFEHLRQRASSLSFRRAYASLQKLGDLRETLRRHGIKAEANHGKGSTDMVMALDVMDLLHAGQLPRLVALASSDADFAPLAVRLREAGRYVICYAQREKSALDDLRPFYDEVVLIDELPAQAPVTHPASLSSASPRTAVSPASNLPDVPPVAVSDADRSAVQKILSAVPEWLPDTVKQLNQLGAPLREQGIKKGSRPLHDLFRKYPAFFKVLPPTGQAKQVRLLRKP